MEKLDGMSMNVEQAEMEKLKAVFPQCFAEGKLDIDKLLSLQLVEVREHTVCNDLTLLDQLTLLFVNSLDSGIGIVNLFEVIGQRFDFHIITTVHFKFRDNSR